MKQTISLAILSLCAAGTVALVVQAQAPKQHSSLEAPQQQVKAPVQAEDYLEIGSARVTLGMTKAQVAEALRGYSVTKKNGDEWSLDISGPQQVELGQMPEMQLVLLQFTAGRLNWANKDWPVRQGDVAGTVFSLVSHWQYERMARIPFLMNCALSADVPSQDTERVWVYCGQKAVVIAKHTLTGGATVQGISEVLGERRP